MTVQSVTNAMATNTKKRQTEAYEIYRRKLGEFVAGTLDETEERAFWGAIQTLGFEQSRIASDGETLARVRTLEKRIEKAGGREALKAETEKTAKLAREIEEGKDRVRELEKQWGTQFFTRRELGGWISELDRLRSDQLFTGLHDEPAERAKKPERLPTKAKGR